MLAPISPGPKRIPSSFGGLQRYLQYGRTGQERYDRQTGELLERGEIVYSENILDRETAALEMRAVAVQNTRADDPVLHYQLAWPNDEKPTREQWEEAAKKTIDDLGMSDHQYMIAAHNDTDHFHVHVMLNRIHPETYRAADLWRDKERLDKSIREIEHQQGWKESPGLYQWDTGCGIAIKLSKEEKQAHREQGREEQQPSGRPGKMERYQDAESLQSYIKGEPAKAVRELLKRDGTTWKDLHAKLDSYGLTLHKGEHGGYTISADIDGKAVHVKASNALRANFAGKAERAQTEAKLGAWSDAVQPAAGHTTNRQQLRTAYGIETSELPKAGSYKGLRTLESVERHRVTPQEGPDRYSKHREPQRNQEQRAEAREERRIERQQLSSRFWEYRRAAVGEAQKGRAALAKEQKARYAELSAENKRAREQIRMADIPPRIKQAMRSVAAAEAVKARESLRAEYAERRQQINAASRPMTERAWVTAEAAKGDIAATRRLRGMDYQARRQERASERETQAQATAYGGLGLGAIGQSAINPAQIKKSAEPLLWERIGHSIDKRSGAVAYTLDGKAAFVDHGRRITMSTAQRTDDSVAAGLQLALQKFGPVLEVHGTAEYRQQVVRVAVDRGLRVQYTDPALTKLQENLIAERETAARPVQPAAEKYREKIMAQLAQREQERGEQKTTPTRPPQVAEMTAGQRAIAERRAREERQEAAQEAVKRAQAQKEVEAQATRAAPEKGFVGHDSEDAKALLTTALFGNSESERERAADKLVGEKPLTAGQRAVAERQAREVQRKRDRDQGQGY